MRDPERINPFLEKLGKIWKENCPDWRFGQLIENVFGESKYVIFYMEEDRMLTEFNNYFVRNNKSTKKTRRKKDEPRERGSNEGNIRDRKKHL